MRPLHRHSLLIAATAATALLGLNAGFFQHDALALSASFDRQQADGVPAAELAPLRASLAGRATAVHTFTTPAVIANPFDDLVLRSVGARHAALDRARQRAGEALGRLARLRGGPESEYADQRTALESATTPSALALLADRWTADAAVVELERRTLAERAGGLTAEGRPQDLADLASQLEGAMAAAASAGVDPEPAPDARDSLAGSWTLPVDAQLDRHEDLGAAARSALEMVTRRVDSKRRAIDLAGRVDGLLALASVVGVPAEVRAQALRGRDAARPARTEAEVHAAVSDLDQATTALTAIIARATDAPLPSCLDSRSAGQLIWIHLASQQLIAYQDGCPWLGTQVTTGRPALPTDRGTFQVFYKAPAYKMVSPWPKGSPYWYADAWVYWAMEFVGDGTFMHNADWQPDSTYGPGSQYGPYASHGCVHVPDAALARLYAWTAIGATVIVSD